jgi:carbon-monoxide dehydrogenase medium subunit
MKSACFALETPESLEQAIGLLRDSQGMGKALAGGQSLGPMMNMRLAQPELLVNVAALNALRKTEETDQDVVIGAAITHAEIEDSHIPDPTGGLLSHVASAIAYRAVRNRGTLGGSLAHADPAADWINLMPLLNATMIVVGPRGTREIAAAHWMIGTFTTALDENEILVEIRIPKLSKEARRSYYKINRKPGEFSEATAGFVIDTVRNICCAVIGATDGPPTCIENAEALIAELRGGEVGTLTNQALIDAGLEPDTHSYQLHAVAMLRAVVLLDSEKGKMQ